MTTSNSKKVSASARVVTALSVASKSNSPSLGLAQSKSGPTHVQKKLTACSLCQKVAVLEPAFEEELAERSFVLELCRECYERAGEDEKWLKQQLRLLATTSPKALKKGTLGMGNRKLCNLELVAFPPD